MSASRTRPLSVRVDSKIHERVNRLAKATDRPRTWIVEKALQQYLDLNTWQVEAITDAVKQADEGGPFVEHDKVKAWLKSWGTKSERRRPR